MSTNMPMFGTVVLEKPCDIKKISSFYRNNVVSMKPIKKDPGHTYR